jgi:hypothetical protein
LTKAKGEEREKTAAAIRQFLCKAGPSLQSFAIRGGQPPNRDTPSSLSQASSSSEQGKGTLKRGGITDSSRGTLKTKKGAKSNADAAAPQLRFGPALGAALECLVGSTEAPSACAGLQRLELQGNEAGEETASVLASIVETHPALVELGCDDNAISLAVYGKLLDCATRPKSGGCGLTRLSVPVMDARRSKDKDEAKRVVERVERFNRGERETAAAVAEKSDKKSSKAKKNEGEEVAPTKGKHEKTTTKKSKAKQGDEDDDTAATKTEKEEDKKAEDVGAKLVGSASKTATKKKKAKGAKKAEKEKEKDDDKDEADEEKTTKSEETAEPKSEAKLQSQESTAKLSEGDQEAKSATKEAKQSKTKTKTKKTSKANETAPADDAPAPSGDCDNGDGEEADDTQEEEKKAKKGGKKSKKSKASKQTNKESN